MPGFHIRCNHGYEKGEVCRCVRFGRWAGNSSGSPHRGLFHYHDLLVRHDHSEWRRAKGFADLCELAFFSGVRPRPIRRPTGSLTGAIFHFDPNNVAATYTIAHLFAGHDADDGDNPRHDGMTPLNGLLYGTTLRGWNTQHWNHFSIGQDGTGYQVLFSLHNSVGEESHSCFVVANDIFYGMTAAGGDEGEGVIFSFNPATPTPTPTATPTPTPSNFQTAATMTWALSS
jgi:uncharacterized repeat protein (TIGR03803 family)